MAVRRPPSDLQPAGKRFWREVLAAYDLNEAELRLLAEACRTTDELERLQAALTAADTVVAGSTGQLRVHPLFDEVRRHRETLQRLTGAMAIPAVGEDEGRTAVSGSARAAAEKRWAGHRRGAS
jgi:hypothetical protein